jgi:hypothetical protein
VPIGLGMLESRAERRAQVCGGRRASRLRYLIPLGFCVYQSGAQGPGTRLIYVPPSAAVELTRAQHRQGFDARDAGRLRNRQRFAGEMPLARDPSFADASSVRTLGIRYVACIRSGIPLGELALSALALGLCAGISFCTH